ncbi:hypothetical protein BGZ99_002328, partial [Dissophora globulifera]
VPSTLPSNVVNVQEWKLHRRSRLPLQSPYRDGDGNGNDDDDDEGSAVGTSADASAAFPKTLSRVSEDERPSKIVQNSQLDKSGRGTIFVPVSLGTSENYRKALVIVWSYQSLSFLAFPNLATHSGKDLMVWNIIKQYSANSVYTKTTTVGERTLTRFSQALYQSPQSWRSSFTSSHNKVEVGTFCMAHFRRDEPYLIERDLVTPPLESQRLIFPWIEDAFMNDEEMRWKTESWIEECRKEMLGVDSEAITESDIHFTPVEQTMSHKGLTAKLVDSALVGRIGFLKLLVRSRRVILQDAVLYLKPDANGQTLSNDPLESFPGIFKSTMFLTFQDELLRAMEVCRANSYLANPQVQLHSYTVIQTFNRINQLLEQLL